MGEVVVAEVLAVGWQLVVLERGQNLLQLQEEALTGGVAVGEHVEGVTGTVPAVSSGADYRGTVPQMLEQLHVLFSQQRGRGDGDGLVTSREHRPAVAAALGDIERLTRSEPVQHRQIVDAALRPLRETEARGFGRGGAEVAVLDTNQATLTVIVRL